MNYGLRMNIDITDKQKDIKISKAAVKKIAAEVVRFEGETYDEVSIHFITNKAMCDLHDEYFDDPSPTDCISFPLDDDTPEEFSMMGDIFICPKTAIEYSAKNPEVTPTEEVTLYVVHGLLHLMGYDDMNDKDRAQMRKAEKSHMANLRSKKLVL